MHHHHSAHCHDHTLIKDTSRSHKVTLLSSVLVLVGCFSLVELAVGLWSNSLALLADSGHMISDTLALCITLFASWISQFKSSKENTLGYQRIEVISALINGIGLVAIALWIGWEAIARLQSPPDNILSLPMLITAGVGLGVNSINVLLLHDSSHHDINLRGAFLHIVADVISSVGVILAAIAVAVMHWQWADPVISLFGSGLIILSAIPLIIQSWKILHRSFQSNLVS